MIRYEDRGLLRLMLTGDNADTMQGAMLRERPSVLLNEYTACMMAWMLFENPEDIAQRHAMQLGLGPGALTKYCHNMLSMRTTAVEIDPAIVAACRDWFLLPPNGDKLEVIVGDAAAEIARPERRATVDTLQVDVYDPQSDRPALDDAAFWSACKLSLTTTGCLTVNLYGRSPLYNPWDTVERIRQVFSTESMWVLTPVREANLIVIARNTPMPQDATTLVEHAATIQTRFGLPASAWLHQMRCPLPMPGLPPP